MTHTFRSVHKVIAAGFAVAVVFSGLYLMPAFAANAYGDGAYGACGYGNCGISVSSNGTVSVNVTPTGNTTCTVQKDTVTITTDSSTGYTLKLNDSDTVNTMTGSKGGTVAASSGTSASPVSLAANSWGFRVDSIGGFGAGPTSAVTNGGIPAQTYAAVPLSNGTAATLATTTSPANPAVSTSVWYGLCASSSLPSGTFSDGVVYTAVVN